MSSSSPQLLQKMNGSQHFSGTCIMRANWRRCFAQIRHKYKGISNRVLKLNLTDGRIVYVSTICSDGVEELPTSSLPDVVEQNTFPLYLNPEFARLHGISENEDVDVELIAPVSIAKCISMTAQVQTVEHWRLLQHHATRIEEILQDHIRVVQQNQFIPIHLNASTCIILKVTSVEPASAAYVQLTRGTEVIVTPPDADLCSAKDAAPPPTPPDVPQNDSNSKWLTSVLPWLREPMPTATLSLRADSSDKSRHDNHAALHHASFPETSSQLDTLSNGLNLLHQADIDKLLRLINCTTIRLHSPFNILLCGNRKTGKSSLLDQICCEAEKQLGFRVQKLHARDLAGRKSDHITSALETIVEKAFVDDRCIVAIDDLHLICGAASDENALSEALFADSKISANIDDHHSMPANNNNNSDQTRIAYFLIELQRLLRHRTQHVIFLFTALSQNSVNTLLHSSRLHGRHFFDHIASITPPDDSARLQFVAENLMSRLRKSTTEIDSNEILAALDTDRHYFYEKTFGFYAGDLDLLSSRIAHEIMLLKAGSTTKLSVADVIRQSFDAVYAEKSSANPFSLSIDTQKSKSRVKLKWSDAEATVSKVVIDRLRDIFELRALHPALVAACPINLPRGALLFGLPGSGKTFLCRLVAEAASFRKVFFVKGPELLTKYVGASEARVRQLFADARQYRPSLIVFDEFDALAPRRGNDSTGVTDRVVNQLLAELDGAEDSSGICVMATSSRPDLIDEALLRPGRIDVSLKCELPNEAERLALLTKMCAELYDEIDIGDDKFLQALASQCVGFSAADMRALVYEAILNASKRRRDLNVAGDITFSKNILLAVDFESALNVVKPTPSPEDRVRFELGFMRFIANSKYKKNVNSTQVNNIRKVGYRLTFA